MEKQGNYHEKEENGNQQNTETEARSSRTIKIDVRSGVSGLQAGESPEIREMREA